jgi:hypothetical protein
LGKEKERFVCFVLTYFQSTLCCDKCILSVKNLKMKKLILPTAFVILQVLSSQTNADLNLMAIWDFGPNADGYTLVPQYEYVIGTPALVASGAEYDSNGKDGCEFTDYAGNHHDEGQAVAWNDVSGTDSDAEWIMTINTTGWQDMVIRWDYLSDATGGNQGPTSFDFDYKIGDGSWENILNNHLIIRDDTWHEFSYDLSLITAVENQPLVSFRVNDLERGSPSPDGDYKFDNLQLVGLPEPGSFLLLAFGSLVLMRKGRFANA